MKTIIAIGLSASVFAACASHADTDNYISYSLENPIQVNGTMYSAMSFDVSFGIGHTAITGAILTQNGVSLPFTGSCLATTSSSFFCSLNAWSHNGFLTIFTSTLAANFVMHDHSGATIGASSLRMLSVK